MNKPWERQPGEGSRAYEAFKTYLDFGPKRSITKVADKLNKSNTIIARWCRENLWVKRCDAWEAEQDREWLLERKRAAREAGRRHYTISRAMTGKLAKRIETIDVSEITPADAARWLDVLVKVERLSLGMSTNNQEVTGKDGGPIEHVIDADERRRLLRPFMSTQAGQDALNKLADLADQGMIEQHDPDDASAN